MKKLTAALLALILILSLTACANNEKQSLEAPITETTEPAADQNTGDSTDGTESVPNVTVPEETQSATQETKPEVTQPVETTPTEVTPAETKPNTQPTTPNTPSGTTPAEPKPTEPKPTEPKPTEPKPTEPKPTTPKPTGSNHEHKYEHLSDDSQAYCTQTHYSYIYCSCGASLRVQVVAREHTFQRQVVNKATHDKEGLANLTCIWCPYTTTEVIPKVNVPYFVKIEMVSCERPNSIYLSDGTQVLDKIYGKYKAAQVGDTYTYRIVMSDGGTTGFTVKNNHASDANMTVNGNLVTMTVTNMTGNAYFGFSVETNDIDNNKVSKAASMKIVMGNCRLTDLDQNGIYVALRDYITRNGMQSYLTLLNEFNFGELTSYTDGDPTKSITGTGKYGYDDYIVPAVHSDWLDMYFNLIDTYKARGFTKVYMYYTGGAIELKAC